MSFAGPSTKVDDPTSIRTEWPMRVAAMPANALGAGWAANDSFGFGHAVRVLVKNLALKINSRSKLHEPFNGFASHQRQPPGHCQVRAKWHGVFATHVFHDDLHDCPDQPTH